ncbi:MAG TPA: hypothetical protein ENK60_09040 [Anaerolineae bacterium]|nr:hypothetical protein [Anaerolineae bacterium]
MSQPLVFNGVNAVTGDYSLPPMTPDRLAAFITGQTAIENLEELRQLRKRATQRVLGVVEGIDATDLAQAGWGVIFPADADPAIQEALQPLLDWRRAQAGDLFRMYQGPDGLRPGESRLAFMMRHGVGFGIADPKKMPYYLLLVGDPDAIPYDFQYGMDMERAVGRIHFDRVQDYASYAESVVAYEKARAAVRKRVAFFCPDHDPATRLATKALVQPLIDALIDPPTQGEISTHLGPDAMKSRMLHLICDPEARPDLLFSATHGMVFPANHPQQRTHQGALLCQDWPGPNVWHGPITPDLYLSADDLPAQVRFDGLIAFFFACFSNGTPRTDDFTQWAFRDRAQPIAPAPFLARLSTRMLAQGALAVLGHVERAWSFSFQWMGTTFPQTTTYESVLKALMAGKPAGLAFEYFDSLYADFTMALTQRLKLAELEIAVDPVELAGFWTASTDARNFTILGDPAVRLA